MCQSSTREAPQSARASSREAFRVCSHARAVALFGARSRGALGASRTSSRSVVRACAISAPYARRESSTPRSAAAAGGAVPAAAASPAIPHDVCVCWHLAAARWPPDARRAAHVPHTNYSAHSALKALAAEALRRVGTAEAVRLCVFLVRRKARHPPRRAAPPPRPPRRHPSPMRFSAPPGLAAHLARCGRACAPQTRGARARSSFAASLWRGGTSNALLLLAPPAGGSVPSDAQLAAAMGAPDAHGRQLDGMGGGTSSTSKARRRPLEAWRDAAGAHRRGMRRCFAGVEGACTAYSMRCVRRGLDRMRRARSRACSPAAGRARLPSGRSSDRAPHATQSAIRALWPHAGILSGAVHSR